MKVNMKKMCRTRIVIASLVLSLSAMMSATATASIAAIGVDGPNFTIDGRLSYEAIEGANPAIYGMLFGVYAGNAIADDSNTETAKLWSYPDTGKWDADRNTNELISSLPSLKDKGISAISVNFQGSTPTATKGVTGWQSSGFNPDGSLRLDYLDRLSRLLVSADRLDMVVVLSLFNSSQDQVLLDETAVKAAVTSISAWLVSKGHLNVIIDVAESCDIGYDHAIFSGDRVCELIGLAREAAGGRLLVSASFSGTKAIPPSRVIEASDCVLICTGGTKLKANIDAVLVHMGDNLKPIYHIKDSDKPSQLFTAAENYTSWNYFEQGKNDYQNGWNSLPINWSVNTDKKADFLGSTTFWVWAGERE